MHSGSGSAERVLNTCVMLSYIQLYPWLIWWRLVHPVYLMKATSLCTYKWYSPHVCCMALENSWKSPLSMLCTYNHHFSWSQILCPVDRRTGVPAQPRGHSQGHQARQPPTQHQWECQNHRLWCCRGTRCTVQWPRGSHHAWFLLLSLAKTCHYSASLEHMRLLFVRCIKIGPKREDLG